MKKTKIKTALFSFLVFIMLGTLSVSLSGPVFYGKRTLPEFENTTTSYAISTTNSGMRKTSKK